MEMSGKIVYLVQFWWNSIKHCLNYRAKRLTSPPATHFNNNQPYTGNLYTMSTIKNINTMVFQPTKFKCSKINTQSTIENRHIR